MESFLNCLFVKTSVNGGGVGVSFGSLSNCVELAKKPSRSGVSPDSLSLGLDEVSFCPGVDYQSCKTIQSQDSSRCLYTILSDV